MLTNDVYWLAGLLEGEGFFGIISCHQAGKIYRYPRIGVSMCDRDIVERVSKIFGGVSVYALKPQGTGARLPQFRTLVSGKRAAHWMTILRPIMGTRRQTQIDRCLEEWDKRPSARELRSASMKIVVAPRRRNAKGQLLPNLPIVDSV